jgi:hypothetical protein
MIPIEIGFDRQTKRTKCRIESILDTGIDRTERRLCFGKLSVKVEEKNFVVSGTYDYAS